MKIVENEIMIREANKLDAPFLEKWWNDGLVMEHAGFPLGLNINMDDIEKRIEKNKIGSSKLCMLEVEGEIIGETSFRIFTGYAEIGIKICEKSFQNMGLGTKFLKMLIEYLFLKLPGIEKIVLDTNLKNLRAQHVYEKLGFKKVRVNVDSWKNQVGVWQSSVDYELTKDYYNQLRKDKENG